MSRNATATATSTTATASARATRNPILRDGVTMTEVVYTCSGCQATDTVRLFPSEAPPPAINCWNCGAGRGKQVPQMIHQETGMFPAVEHADGPIN